MGVFYSKRKIPDDVYRFWSAVASSVRLGWLGTDRTDKEMKVCQLALFPLLLNDSALQGDIVGLEGHLQQGADVSTADARGRTPLHVAAGEGDLEMVEFLLQKGAEVNCRDVERETPLRDAIRSNLAFLGDSEQMEVWKKAGACFNLTDADGRTPLHVVVSSNQPEMVKFCICNGSDLELRDAYNNLPVDDARRLGYEDLVKMLTEEAQRQSQKRAAKRTLED
ncbi:L-asparaginase [Electrophorus electricus]|uniref:L-asparaginase n=1 Tax=Electrophorus electricus TaxID=8005 RepID=UPI0015D03C43|nr:L-asparaginase [Electrophorus electricus]